MAHKPFPELESPFKGCAQGDLLQESRDEAVSSKPVLVSRVPDALARNSSDVHSLQQEDERVDDEGEKDNESDERRIENEALEKRSQEMKEGEKEQEPEGENNAEQSHQQKEEKPEQDSQKGKERGKREEEGDTFEEQGDEKDVRGRGNDEKRREVEERGEEQCQSEKKERDQEERRGQDEQRDQENTKEGRRQGVDKKSENNTDLDAEKGKEKEEKRREIQDQGRETCKEVADQGKEEALEEKEDRGEELEDETMESEKHAKGKNVEERSQENAEDDGNETEEHEDQSQEDQDRVGKNKQEPSSHGNNEPNYDDKERDSEDEDGDDEERDSEDEEGSSEDEEGSSEYEEQVGEHEEQVSEDEERSTFYGVVDPITNSGADVTYSSEGSIHSRVEMRRRISVDCVCPDFVIKQAQSDFRIEATQAKQECKFVTTFSKREGVEEELQGTCISALKLLKCLDTSDEISRHREQFVRKVFAQFSDDHYHHLQQQADKDMTKNSGLSLRCEVIEGCIMKKSNKGTGQVYVKLGIIPQTEYLAGRKPHKRRLATMGPLVKEVFITQPASNQIWNETFELEILQGLKGCLFLEARLMESNESKKSKAKESKEMINLQAPKKDKFIGYAIVPLKKVVEVVGVKQTLKLVSRGSEAKPKGTIMVNLAIHGSKKREQIAFQEYYDLLLAVIAHESKEKSEKVMTWNGQLSDEAEKFLSAYSSVHRLTNLKQRAKLLSVLIYYRLTYGSVQMAEFQKLIPQIQSESAELNHYSPESHATWLMHLLNDLKKLWICAVEFIQSCVAKGDFGQCHDLNDLESSILVLESLHGIDVFVEHRLQQDKRDCHQVLCHCIQFSVSKCFDTPAVSTADTKRDDQKLTRITNLCERYQDILETVRSSIHPIFDKFRVDCYSIVFVLFDELLEREVKGCLAPVDEIDPLETLKVYQIIKTFLPFVAGVNPSVISQEKERLALHSYHSWFHHHVERWIDHKQEETRRISKRLLSHDQDQYEPDAPLSVPVSVFHVNSILDEVAKLWNDLCCWPDKAQSCDQCIAIAKISCDVVMFYAQTASSNGGKEVTVDSHGMVPLTEQFCFHLKGVEHFRSQLLKNISDLFKMDSFWLRLESDDSTTTLGIPEETKILKETKQAEFEELITTTSEKILSTMILKVIEMLTPMIHLHLSKIASNSSSAQEEIISLVEFMQENLLNLKRQGSDELFVSVLENLWLNVLQELRKQKNKLPRSKLKNRQNLFHVLQSLKEFFNSKEAGLAMEQLHNKEYEDLFSEMKLAQMTTDELIVQCLIDLSSFQGNESNLSLGIIKFSHLYVEADNNLEVCVVAAEGLPSEEINVELLLLPRKLRTSIQKLKCSEAFCSESLKLKFSKELLAENGSTLVLVVRTNSMLGLKQDVLGICVISCKNIPSGDERKMEHLPLFQFPLRQNKFFVELEIRKQNEAEKFCEQMKKLVVPGKYLRKPK